MDHQDYIEAIARMISNWMDMDIPTQFIFHVVLYSLTSWSDFMFIVIYHCKFKSVKRYV